MAEWLVDGAVAAGGAGKHCDFVDEHRAAVEVCQLCKFPGKNSRIYLSAGAPEREMRDEAAFFGAVAELEQVIGDGGLKGDHCVAPLPCSEPKRTGTIRRRERARAVCFQFERFVFGRGGGDGIADSGDFQFADFAEELKGPVEILRLDPFHVRNALPQAAHEVHGAVADLGGEFDGDESADFGQGWKVEGGGRKWEGKTTIAKLGNVLGVKTLTRSNTRCSLLSTASQLPTEESDGLTQFKTSRPAARG